jgi:hypothetical protein
VERRSSGFATRITRLLSDVSDGGKAACGSSPVVAVEKGLAENSGRTGGVPAQGVGYVAMRTISLAVILGVVLEGLLWGAFSLFGKISWTDSSKCNVLGSLFVFFHLPGTILSQSLFTLPPNFSGVYMPSVFFNACIGAIQFTLLAWLGIVIYRRRKNSKAASSAS